LKAFAPVPARGAKEPARPNSLKSGCLRLDLCAVLLELPLLSAVYLARVNGKVFIKK
jgi:hypothetical protein